MWSCAITLVGSEIYHYNYAPNFKEVVWACLCICLCICLCVCLSVTLCLRSRTVRDRILKLNIWNVQNKRTVFFFLFHRTSLQSYAPFRPVSNFGITRFINLWNLVNGISREPLERCFVSEILNILLFSLF